LCNLYYADLQIMLISVQEWALAAVVVAPRSAESECGFQRRKSGICVLKSAIRQRFPVAGQRK
jgi:hypothetical protein